MIIGISVPWFGRFMGYQCLEVGNTCFSLQDWVGRGLFWYSLASRCLDDRVSLLVIRKWYELFV